MVMTGRRPLSLLTLMLVAVLVLSGCVPRLGAAALSTNSGGEAMFINMPSLMIEFDENGGGILFGKPVAELGDSFSSISMSEETLQQLMDGNIQHIQVDNQPNVLRVYINNKPIPRLIFDDEAFAALGETLAIFGTESDLLNALLPMLPKLGMGIAIQVPPASGKSAIKLATPKDNVLKAQDAISQFKAAKEVPPTVDLTIDYKEDGNFDVGGINPLMMNMLPIPWDALKQPPDTIASVSERGIESINVRTVPGGLLLAINGNTLPFIRWGSNTSELTEMLDLVGIMLSGDDAAFDPSMLNNLVPIFNFPGSLSITISFPAAPEAG